MQQESDRTYHRRRAHQEFLMARAAGHSAAAAAHWKLHELHMKYLACIEDSEPARHREIGVDSNRAPARTSRQLAYA